MIKQEEAEYFFKARAIDKPNLEQLNDLDASYQGLGKIISQKSKEHKENAKKSYSKARDVNEINLELFNTLFKEKDFTFNPFETKQGETLALMLFGEVLGTTLAKVWYKIDFLPYQTGYYRRSFRMKKVNEDTLKKKLRFLQNLYGLRVGKTSSALFNMSILEITQYMVYTSNHTLALPLCVYVEQENQEALKTLIWDIF